MIFSSLVRCYLFVVCLPSPGVPLGQDASPIANASERQTINLDGQ
jgi:hypothetical protein